MTDPKRFVKKAFCTALTGIFIFILLSAGQAIFTQHLPEDKEPPVFYSTEMLDDLQLLFGNGIKGAKESILLVIYSLHDPKIIYALRNQAAMNIPVTVICDLNASKGVAKKLGPKVKTIFRKGKGLMHRKILVVDNKKIWIGSANMTTTSLKMHGNLVLGLDSPKLAKSITRSANTMSKVGFIYKNLRETFELGGQPGELYLLPDNPPALQKLRDLIQTAQKSIKVAMFTFTRHDLANDLIQAHSRGVQTEVVIDRSAAESSSAEIVKRLAENHLPVRLSQGDALLHHKMMVVDDSILVNGSANWTKSAFIRNDDCFIVLYNLTPDQREYLSSLWEVIYSDSESVELSRVKEP